MSDYQNIKRMLLPALKGIPVILICLLLAIATAYRSIEYTNPVYESTIKIKLDDISNGISSSALYEDFDVFANTNKIAAEVEVLKSKVLIEKTLQKLDFDVSYFRVGKIRTTELYNESPFYIEYKIHHKSILDEFFDLRIISENSFVINYTLNKISKEIKADFGDILNADEFTLVVHNNDSLSERKISVDLIDHYKFRINSIPHIVDNIIGNNLDVVAVDDDVAVVRISYKCEVPEKTAAFVNTLGQTYIEDYIESRTGAAAKTVDFIDRQLGIIAEKLKDSETQLEKYRLKHNIINTQQETETDLRKIAQLKIQLANLEMNEAALDSLQNYISQKDIQFVELAPNFEAFNDLLSTELIKKIKTYQDEKKDLLLKYTLDDEKVKVIDEKINDVANYIRESIKNTHKNIGIKRKEMETTIDQANKFFEGLPTKEKHFIVLQREFQLNQKIFNFLTEKRTEAAIAKAVTISFHRIIQQAYIPLKPISPKKTLMLIVSALLGLIIGTTLVYAKEFVGGKIRTRDQLEKVISTPVAGIIKNYNRRAENIADDFLSLITNLKLLNGIKKHQSILFTSTIAKEGKSFAALNIARAFADLEWSVVLIDLNFRNSMNKEFLELQNKNGIAEVVLQQCSIKDAIYKDKQTNVNLIPVGISVMHPAKLVNDNQLPQVLNELKNSFDLVIIDSPGTADVPESIKLMELCDQVYYIIKANYTRSQFLMNADLITKEYGIKNINILLNNVAQAVNFNGRYSESDRTIKPLHQKLFSRIDHLSSNCF